MNEVIQFPDRGANTETSPEIHTGDTAHEAVVIDLWSKKIKKAITSAVSEAMDVRFVQE